MKESGWKVRKEPALFKTCTKCGQVLPATTEFFSRDSHHADGLFRWCKDCSCEYSRRYRENHRDPCIERSRKWYAENPEAGRNAMKRWRQANKEHVREYERAYWAKRPKTAQLKISRSMAKMIHSALRDLKDGHPWQEFVDFSLGELLAHLESRFENGMNWDNYGEGGWHIDHVTPQSWFRYSSTDDPQFKECWALSNLQPMWGKENSSKCNRYKGKLRPPEVIP